MKTNRTNNGKFTFNIEICWISPLENNKIQKKYNTYINIGEFQFHVDFRSPSSLWLAITSEPNIRLKSFKKQKNGNS